MPGQTDLLAQAALNWTAGLVPFGAIGPRWLGLFTTAPTSDAATANGSVEVSGGNYARAQFAGAVTVSSSSGAPSTSSKTFALSASAPSWLTSLGNKGSGCYVYDVTGSAAIGAASSISGATVTLTSNAAQNGSLGDTVLFSAFPMASASSGSEPAVNAATSLSGAAINFAPSTANWGTVVALGIFDAPSDGNLLFWDFTGAGKWSPFTCASGRFTCSDQTFANNQYLAFSSKNGGVLPSFSAGSLQGAQQATAVSGNTFAVLGLTLTSAGDGMVRPVSQFVIGASTTASFSANSLTLVSG